MSFPRLLLCAAVLSASASAFAGPDVPRTHSFEPSTQLQSMSVQHWDLIAQDVVATAVKDLGDRTSRGVFVKVSPEASAFELQLSTFVIDAFHQAGVKVYSKAKDSVLTVDLAAKVAVHASGASVTPPVHATALAAGLVVLRKVALQSWRASLVWTGVATDVLRATGKEPPRSELAVTLSIQDADEYVARASNVYYVDGADVGLFVGPTPLKTLKLEAK